jgi:hypothetical protein
MLDFTPEDLISYLYGEMDDHAKALMDKALESNWALREKMSVLQASIQRLDKSALLSPSSSTMDRILAYATDKSKIPH